MFDFRPATRRDLDFLAALRNDPLSVRHSKRGTLPRAVVEADFLEREDKRSFVALRAGVAVGYAAFEILGADAAEISVALAKACRGRAWAAPLIAEASAHGARALRLRTVRALIAPDNERSRRAFQRAGYRRAPADDDAPWWTYVLTTAWGRQTRDARVPARGPSRPPPAAPPPR